MRPFRILIVDDDLDRSLGIDANLSQTIAAANPDQAHWILRELIFETPRINDVPLVIYLARDLYFNEDSVTEVTDTGEPWDVNYLWSMDGLDVLVLDFGDVYLADEWNLEKGDPYVAGATDSQINELNTIYHGAAFYLKNRDRLAHCQAIMFFTQYDGPASPEVINKFIKEPFCDDDVIPQTLMFNPSSSVEISRLTDKLKAFYIAYAEGYTQLENLAAIDFAATHDESVLIVGETGTGKEYIARQIHRRWRQEKNDGGIPEEPVVVNCAALTEDLARDELFGHVRGAFTGADDHKIGAVLTACGCSSFRVNMARIRQGIDNVTDFERGFVAANDGRVRVVDDTIKFTSKEPSGTLFLDEFGDLTPSVQTLLLRYLQSTDVQPFGYPRVISGANVRIIAATSDPRVAKFVGVQLYGGWRSRAEMERPLREDLIFRVKGQVVRAERITADNVEKALRHFVSQFADQRGKVVKWDDSAYEYLIPELQKQLKAIDKAVKEGREGAGELPAFGHRRELVRIVKLANAYVSNAAGRGLRRGVDAVTREVVERVWKPSVVLSFETSSPADKAPALPEVVLKDEGNVEGEHLLDLIESFFESRSPTLPSGWRAKRARERGFEFYELLKQMAASSQYAERNELRDMITKTINKNRGKGTLLYEYVFGAKGGTVAQWFSRSKS